MKRKDWNKRISKRNDMVSRITHLTRGKDSDEAFENLWQILIDKKINGSGLPSRTTIKCHCRKFNV